MFLCKCPPNGLRYLRVGGRWVDAWEQEKELEARKMLACTVPQAQVKMPQIPPVRCTLCSAVLRTPKLASLKIP